MDTAEAKKPTVRHRAQFATMHGPISTWLRQTPEGDGRFGDSWFREHATGAADEWLVVCDEPPPGLSTRIPPARRVLFIGEPRAIKTYQPDYLNQFGFVVGPIPLPGFAGIHLRRHGSLPWHYGKARPLAWADLLRDKPKDRCVSVFCSDKTLTRQQEQRIRFVENLKRTFGSLVDHFGHGFNRLEEKADGLDPYRYTVVLENNLEDGFWTEKLGDAYLGHCFPIYSGGTIPPDDFDPRARLEIDVSRLDESLARISALLRSNRFEGAEDLIREQRRRVMVEHNLFAVADRLIARAGAAPGLLSRSVPVHQGHDCRPALSTASAGGGRRLGREIVRRLFR